jgi:hypothetical protein
MGPMDTQHGLNAARETFSDWDIYEVFGGYLAVPKGTPLVQGMYLATVADKLRAMQDGE